MASARSDLIQAVKFDGRNFQLWKFSVNILLKAEKLLGIVDGSVPEPPDNTNGARDKWDEQNSRAQVILLTTIAHDVMQSLVNCTTAAQMWKKLLSIYEQKTAISKELLWQQFYEYKMNNGDTITAHLTKIESIVGKLKDANESVSDSAICTKALTSLPQKYNAFRTAWDSVDIKNQTFDNLTARLLKEEVRMTTTDDETTRLALQVEALQMELKKQGENRQKKKPTIDELKKNTKCNFCNMKGHWSRECRKRLAQKNNQPSGNSGRNGNNYAYICDLSSLYSANVEADEESWICDSGASMHMTHKREWFKELKPLDTKIAVKVANDKIIQAVGIGTIEIEAKVHNTWQYRIINNVLYIPELRRSLFSVGVMTDKNFTHHANDKKCEFRDPDGNLSCTGTRNNNLWKMLFRVKMTEHTESKTEECYLTKQESLKLWHDRLGHVNCKSLINSSRKGAFKDVTFSSDENFFCEPCNLAKQSRKSHKESESERAEKPGEKIHSDLCGPMNEESPRGSRYFIIFKDDCTGYRTVYFLRHKSEALSKYKEFYALVKTQTGNTIKCFKSDNGTEFTNNEFDSFLKENGIMRENSAPYTPQQNGSSEREIRTIVECARTMMLNRQVPPELWTEAVNTAVYNLNRTGSSRHFDKGTTPYEQWFRKKPGIKHMRTFGCAAYKAIPHKFRRKWDPKSKKLMLVGYDGISTNYRLWDPIQRRIEISGDVKFNEPENYGPTENHKMCIVDLFGQFEDKTAENSAINEDNTEEIPTEDPEMRNQEEQNPMISRTTTLRNRSTLKSPERYGSNIYNYHTAEAVPKNYKEAINSPESEKWYKAMCEEITALHETGTWTLKNPPENANIIDCKWVFSIKSDAKGEPFYKARLVAKGYKQEHGIDYEETFAPVVRYDSIRTLLAIAAARDFHLTHFDIKTAFLNADLEEDIYMKQPLGFASDKNPNAVCQLNKSLYGLKQSPRCWNKRFVQFLDKYNFRKLQSDQCVFIGNFNGDAIYLALYVDDGLVISSRKSAIANLIDNLKKDFQIVVDPSASKFIGLEIKRDSASGSITISQEQYVQKILEKFGMNDCKPVPTPAESGTHLQQPHSDDHPNTKVKHQPYREAVGSLIFLATVSRPDIAYAVSQVSRFLNNWTDQHWVAVKRIFRYLKGTIGFKITYSKNNINLTGYSDADFAGCIDTRRSTSGYIFLLAGGIITWSSQKQAIVAQSTTEAEYVALALATKEAIWIRSLIVELELSISAADIHVDNQSAIKLVKNPEFHKRTKHIDVRYHFIRDVCNRGEIIVHFIDSKSQLADMLTKPLTANVFSCLIEKLKLQSN